MENKRPRSLYRKYLNYFCFGQDFTGAPSPHGFANARPENFVGKPLSHLQTFALALADLRAAHPPKSRAEFYSALKGFKAIPKSAEVKVVISGPVCANDSTKIVIVETLRAFLRNTGVELSNVQTKDVVDGAAPMTIKINRENLTNVQSFLRECGLTYKIS